jgi:hypothetical protein
VVGAAPRPLPANAAGVAVNRAVSAIGSKRDAVDMTISSLMNEHRVVAHSVARVMPSF